MKCVFMRKRLVEYVESELGLRGTSRLPEHLTRAITAHLEQCARCRDEASAIRETLTAADAVGGMEPSVGFKTRTVALLKQEANRPTVPAPVALRLRPVLASVSAIVVVAVVSAVFLPERTQRVELAESLAEFETQVDEYARDIEFLVGVLPSADYEPASTVEQAQLDKIVILASSIEECWDALERNPENEQVRALLLGHMKEEVDTLKSFYELRTL